MKAQQPVRARQLLRLGAVFVAVCGCAPACSAAVAAPQPPTYSGAPIEIHIPAQPLPEALKTLGDQTGLQFAYVGEIDSRLMAPSISGIYSAEAALTRLLQPSGLSHHYINTRTVAIGAGPQSDRDSSEADRRTVLPHSPENSLVARAADLTAAGASSGPTASSSSTGELEQVIVTATKREENAQDIPVSIAVIGTEEIDRRHLIGMEDYLRSIPGVNEIDNGPISNAIVIRGITTSPEYENFYSDTTVASYFDETPITGAAGPGQGGIDVRPVDIERIEVLRGPQGTTFGDASLGGALRIIPAKPKLDGLEGKVSGSYSDTSGFGAQNSMIQGVLNVPVVAGTFALRGAGYRYDESGFYRNIAGIDPGTLAAADQAGFGDFVRGFVQNHVGQIITTGGRVAALWQPTTNLDMSLNYLTQKIEQDGAPVATLNTFEQTRIPITPQGRVRGQAGEANDTHIDLTSFVLHYNLGWAGLTSVASWIDSGSVWASSSNFEFLIPSATGPSDFRSFTAETRLASRLPGRFQFLAGVFYENVNSAFTETDRWPGDQSTNPYGTDPTIGLYTFTRHQAQRAAFGELSYNLTDQLKATVGGRYFSYNKTESTLFEGGLYEIPLGSGSTETLESKDNGSKFKANLSYKPDEDLLLYASWAQGFRLGRPTVGVPVATCDTNGDGLIDGTNVSVDSTRKVNSDSLNNYEIGAKSTLLNRRMIVDAAIYHIDWKGLPIATAAPGSSAVCGYTANAGAATSNGIELQVSLLILEGLRADLGGSYTRAELSKDAPEQGWPKGARLPGSPRASANLAVQYDFGLLGRKAFVRADSLYTGKFYGDLLQTPNTAAGDYAKVDAEAGVAFGDVDMKLFVHNLTNQDAFTWRGTYDRGDAYGYRLRPRTVGVQLDYRFH